MRQLMHTLPVRLSQIMQNRLPQQPMTYRPPQAGMAVSSWHASSDRVQFSGEPSKASKRVSVTQKFTNSLKAAIRLGGNKTDLAKLKKTPNPLDKPTLQHELGHTLISNVSNIPHRGLILTPPDVLGAKLMVCREPGNADELLRHVVMRMAGLASDKTHPPEPGMSEQHWQHYLHAQSGQDLADTADILKAGRKKQWIKLSTERLPQLDTERFEELSSKDNQQTTAAENEEYLTHLENLGKVARFPVVKDAVETAQRMYRHLSDSQVDALTSRLERQSFFSDSDVESLLSEHIPEQQKAKLASELDHFVQKYQDPDKAPKRKTV